MIIKLSDTLNKATIYIITYTHKYNKHRNYCMYSVLSRLVLFNNIIICIYILSSYINHFFSHFFIDTIIFHLLNNSSLTAAAATGGRSRLNDSIAASMAGCITQS